MLQKNLVPKGCCDTRQQRDTQVKLILEGHFLRNMVYIRERGRDLKKKLLVCKYINYQFTNIASNNYVLIYFPDQHFIYHVKKVTQWPFDVVPFSFSYAKRISPNRLQDYRIGQFTQWLLRHRCFFMTQSSSVRLPKSEISTILDSVT